VTRGRRKTTIVIADDLRLVLLALRRELETAEFEICSEATTGADALEAVRDYRPDLALLDIQMPEGRGDDVAAILADELPQVKVVLMTAKTDEEGAVRAIRSGAVGYIDASTDEGTVRGLFGDAVARVRIRRLRAAAA